MTVWDAVHDARGAFRACMDATCAPGIPVAGVPRAGLASDACLDQAAAILLALLDPGLGLALEGSSPEARDVCEAVLRRTGASPAPVESAAFVLICAPAAGVAARARRGTPLVPEDGATLVYAGAGRSEPLSIAGPGIGESSRDVLADLPAGEPAALRRACAAPPTGVDAFCVGAAGLIALPRSVLWPVRVGG